MDVKGNKGRPYPDGTRPRPIGRPGWEAYYRVVRRIPRGRVATYGQVALLAGRPRAARHVGFALAALRGGRHRVPWQRVLGARSRAWAAISILDPMGAAMQRLLLEREGVELDARDRVSLPRFGWTPRPTRGAASRRAARRPVR
jgi:methylated-DNA-protein-cysteine methyltransferase related protein